LASRGFTLPPWPFRGKNQWSAQDFIRDPFDVAMKFIFVKQFTGRNEPIDQFPKRLFAFYSPQLSALLLVCNFCGVLCLPATHGQIPF